MSQTALQEALSETMEVVELGDQKYGVNAWRTGFPRSRREEHVIDHSAGAVRHLGHRIGGAEREIESKRYHLAHAAARCLIALQLEIDGENGHT